MTLFVAWIFFPLVLAAISLGCGLLVERATGFSLPGALLPPLGLALVIVEADLVTMRGPTAQLATPLAVTLAVAGYGLSARRSRKLDWWALGCALAVLAVYAAPIVLSGSATFAGYVTLDDTSTWLALTDRVMDHGRTLGGMAPSTYQQVLTDYFTSGYPLGAFLPLGIGGKLTGQDIAWLFQPTIAFYGALLALAVYGLTARLVSSRLLRALVAFLGAQPALLYAYSLWSGIKELAAAALIALVCAAVAATIERWQNLRTTLPTALAAAALLAVLSPAGGVWLVAPALAVGTLLVVRHGLGRSLRAAVVLAGAVAVLSIPSIAIARSFISGASGGEITSSTDVANLGHPLDTLQALGIWPATDFRSQPHDPSATYVMIGVLLGAVAIGLLLAWRRRALGMPLYLLTGGCGILLVFALEHVGLSSPWLNAKAMAQGSPALVAAGVAGAAALFETGRRTEAMIACAAIAAGVLWSNGLAYSNAWLAPRGQLAELQTIGSRFAGQGPTLMTEPEVYGTRHFLRRIDPEGAADRRRRPIFLLNGQELAKGTYADLDQFQLGGILVYKTIVLRRSPSESRPPSPYHLVWSGRYYDVWQRPDSFPPILEHFRLGDAIQPGAVPSCSDVLRLAQIAGHSGRLVAAPRTPVIAVTLSNAVHPADWQADPTGLLSPTSAGTVEADVTVPSAGRYGVWLGGSFRDSLHIFVDGRVVAATGQHLNGLDVPLGSVALSPGVHRVALRFGGAGLSPGSGGLPWWTGPLLLSRDSDNPPLVSVPSGDAQALCGQNLDWIEAVGGQ